MHTLNLDKFQKNLKNPGLQKIANKKLNPGERLSIKTIGLFKQFSHCSGKSHHIFTGKNKIYNTSGQTISKNSLKYNMSPKFAACKNTHEKKLLDFTSETDD